MTDPDYLPPSAFLQALIREDEPALNGGAAEDARAAELIALTQDPDGANRDWALLLLAQSELETPEAMAALVRGMDDDHHEAALEATIGVALRNPALALPVVAARLDEETIDSMTLEAAALIADRSLLPLLEAIAEEVEEEDDEDDLFADALREAIEACTRGTPPALN
jgi:hypothetical protein